MTQRQPELPGRRPHLRVRRPRRRPDPPPGTASRSGASSSVSSSQRQAAAASSRSGAGSLRRPASAVSRGHPLAHPVLPRLVVRRQRQPGLQLGDDPDAGEFAARCRTGRSVSARASRPARNSKDVGGIRSPVRSSSSAMYSAYNQAMGTVSSPPPVPSVLWCLCAASLPAFLRCVRVARRPGTPVRNTDEDSRLPNRGPQQGALRRFDPTIGFTAGRPRIPEAPGAGRAARSTRGTSPYRAECRVLSAASATLAPRKYTSTRTSRCSGVSVFTASRTSSVAADRSA